VLNQPTPDDLFDFSEEADIAQLMGVESEAVTVEEVLGAIQQASRT